MSGVGLSAVVIVLLLMADTSDGALAQISDRYFLSLPRCLDECSSNANDLRCTRCRLQRLKAPASAGMDNILPPPSSRSLHEVVIRPSDFISYKRMAPSKDDSDLTRTLRRLLSRVSYKYL
ncbi:unnamed protein product [Toxocara canis]|nr:unnamed protein product [Toxocara canis]